jgi:hypothetical protein
MSDDVPARVQLISHAQENGDFASSNEALNFRLLRYEEGTRRRGQRCTRLASFLLFAYLNHVWKPCWDPATE